MTGRSATGNERQALGSAKGGAEKVVRRKRQLAGITECCKSGCTWEQLTEYCASSHPSSPLDEAEAHMIEDRSAERQAVEPAPLPPRFVVGAGAGGGTRGVRGEVGRGRNRGYGKSMGRRKRRCLCQRKSRSRRRYSSIMGNTDRVRVVARAAPVVGTVSPLLTWGRTLHTDLPPDNQQYAYVALYASPYRG